MKQSENAVNGPESVKNLDFVIWRVMRAKERMHRRDVHRLLSARPRLRRTTAVN